MYNVTLELHLTIDDPQGVTPEKAGANIRAYLDDLCRDQKRLIGLRDHRVRLQDVSRVETLEIGLDLGMGREVLIKVPVAALSELDPELDAYCNALDIVHGAKVCSAKYE